ncbi:MAG: hypothetical protein ACTSQI_16205 [Candidatus Helarchaeota archaeon]
MTFETEIQEEIENFFNQTCITEYIFNQSSPAELDRMQKKTPVGTWVIKSIEIGYFIDLDDRVIVGLLNSMNDPISKVVAKFLAAQAQKIER